MQPHIFILLSHYLQIEIKNKFKNMINTRTFCHSIEQEPCLGNGIWNFGGTLISDFLLLMNHFASKK